jgi:hypothetical protein
MVAKRGHATVLLLAAVSVQLWVASIGGAGLELAQPTRQRIACRSLSTMLVLRGGESAEDEVESMQESGPDKEAGTMPHYPPGSLPEWAHEIAEWRNMTMEERVAYAERLQAEAGFDPEEDCEDGFTSSSDSTSLSPQHSENDPVSSASGVFSVSDDEDGDAKAGAVNETNPQASQQPEPHSDAGLREARSIDEAQEMFSSITLPLPPEERAELGQAGYDGWSPPGAQAGRWPSRPGNLYRDHADFGRQRVRLRSVTERNKSHVENDGDYPGVDLSTGKVTDKGIFDSVEERQAFIDSAEEGMGRKFDPRVLAAGGQIKIMWSPDEPVFTNVTERKRIPMALLDTVRRPDEADPNFLLREASKNGEHLEVVRQAEAGADVNHTDPQFSEFTPLHWACRAGHLEVVDVLLGKLGAYGFPLDHAGHTPWHLAMACQHYHVVRYLFPLI